MYLDISQSWFIDILKNEWIDIPTTLKKSDLEGEYVFICHH